MATPEVDEAKLAALAALSDSDLGVTEEDVKIRFAVPLLEALGHTRLSFEHRCKDILLREGLPRGSAVVVETKRPDAPLDAFLGQLEGYASEERCLLAVLTNGHSLRIYSPFWNRARSFAETLVWDFARADLANPRHVADLTNVLSRGALEGGWAHSALLGRHYSIEGTWRTADGIRQQHRDRRRELEGRLRDLGRQAAQLDSDRRAVEAELDELPARERRKLCNLFRVTCVPIIPRGEFGDLLVREPESAAETYRAVFGTPLQRPTARKPKSLTQRQQREQSPPRGSEGGGD